MANGARPRLRLTTSQRIWLLAAGVAAAAVALFAVVVAPLPGPAAVPAIPWPAWVLAFAVSEALVVHVHLERDSHTSPSATWCWPRACASPHPPTWSAPMCSAPGSASWCTAGNAA